MSETRHTPLRDWTALVLAIGLATAVNIVTLAALWDAIREDGPGLSENATQVLVAAFGGIVGVLGAYLGFKAGVAHTRAGQDTGGTDGRTGRQDDPRDGHDQP